ncbi:MAG: hypothetical protein NVSMB2_05000 [Chloroflexota bacterium]
MTRTSAAQPRPEGALLGVAPPSADVWFAAMRRGDFQTAWTLSDAAQRAHVAAGLHGDQPRHQQRVWDGRDLTDATVLVRCYHGLGDTIMFARFLPWLCERARRVIVWAQPLLLPLLRTLQDVELDLLPLHDGAPDVDFDVDIEIMELAHAMRVDVASLPAPARFSVPAAPRLSARRSVGVVGASGPWDPRRSIPPHELAAALSRIDADVFSFALDAALPLPGVRDASTSEILDVASRLHAMDLVISADTMLAHLAGSLRRPIWILLPCDADWRWGDAPADGWCGSPWYPTARLYRQRRRGDWRDALGDVCRDARREVPPGDAVRDGVSDLGGTCAH